jgi:hypothetical protein
VIVDNDNKERLTEQIQLATAHAVQNMRCPECGGGLNVQFAPKASTGKGAGCLAVMCARCRWRVVADGIPSEPAWVQELGRKIVTVDAKNEQS